jgi:hypothetical protein
MSKRYQHNIRIGKWDKNKESHSTQTIFGKKKERNEG